MRGYFDLNRRFAQDVSVQFADVLNVKGDAAASSPVVLTKNQQIFMYVAVFCGVVLSQSVQQGNASVPVLISLKNILIYAAVAFTILPQAYEKLCLNNKVPFVVQLALCFQQGVFCQVVLKAVGAALAG